MGHYQKERYYNYKFSNGESHTMTPIEAHKYAHRMKIDIMYGPNYIEGKKQKSFDGWGWHDSLQRSFKGPKDYRDYLKAHGMVEASINDKPVEQVLKKPIWDENLIWRAIHVHKIDISGRLAEALLNGELDYPEDGML